MMDFNTNLFCNACRKFTQTGVKDNVNDHMVALKAMEACISVMRGDNGVAIEAGVWCEV